ncbi:Calx-beta domain-containing protein [Limnoglobus roseus]|uniref:Calx-beta domain-containing protein n=1 Tax=Limnoglobus roseus TaxID=2598579 RepID=A0A5C1AEZ9_9BACT|nr:Calx-beta domain-containing protein [Limnoglobus roseus]QEL17125.1 hypothetical protein PX52LOC_04106 [Limnoglobus roseus]
MGFSFPNWVSSLRRPTRRPIRRFDRLPGGPLSVTPLEDRTLLTTLGTYALLEGPGAGADTNMVVSTGAWTASSSASWLHTSASGTGNGTASFSYDANTGPTRTGTITIDGNSLSVTQAGVGFTAPSQAGLPLINANLYGARGSAVDPAGNIYFADIGHNRVAIYHPANGQVTDLPATGLISPSAVALDAAGNVYIADEGDNAIKKYSAATGTTTTLTNKYTVNDSGPFNIPEGVAVDASGKVYFTDYSGNRFGVYNPADGSTTTLLKPDVLLRPNQLTIDAAGKVYISDSNNGIMKYDPAAATFSVLVSSGYNGSGGMGVDGRGNVYFSDMGNGAVKVYDAQTTAVTTIITGLNRPTGVAVTPAGDVSVLESNTQSFKILPQAYLNADSQTPAATAGSLAIPVVSLNPLALSGALTPKSDQSWLTVTGVSGGQVNLSYTANTAGTARSANVTLLGRTVAVVQAATASTPVVDSPTVAGVASAAATLGGRLASAGTAAVTKRGILYAPTATNPNPTIGGTGVVELDDASTANGTFTKSATGLSPSTAYSFVAFATNANGTAYSAVSSFATQPTVQFAAASESVNEYEGTFSVTVTLSGPATTDVTVPFTLSGTAANGIDYSDVSASPLVIPAGQTSATITGTIIENGYEATDRTIVFSLGSPANAGLGGTPSETLTILSDSPPSVNFATGGQSVSASAGSFSVVVTLSRPSNEVTTVPFTVSGTAVEGTDYSNLSASPLVIPAGQTSAAITGTLLVNSGAASDPTLTFTLGTPINGRAGDTPPYTLTIQEPTIRPTSIDVGGLEFHAAAGFDRAGNAYTSSQTVQVGLVPASGQPFVALLTLQGGTSIDTAEYLVTNQGAVQSIVGGTPMTLLAGGLNAASIAALTGAGLTGLSASAFTVAHLTFTPTTLALTDAGPNGPAVLLGGRLALPYGLSLDVTGSNHVILDSTGTTLSGVTASVLNSSFTLGGLTFSGLSLGASYNAAADQFVLTGGGTASLTTPNGTTTFTLTFGQGATPGIAFTGGSLTTLTAAVTGNFTVRGVAFAAQALTFSYTTATSTFALSGTATATAAGLGNLSVTFGHGATPGLVVTNGALTSLDTTVGSTFAVNGVTFTTQDLDFSYSAATDRFGLAGTATAAVTKLGNLGVTFGYGSNPGLVITNGSLTSLDMTLNSDVTLGGVTIMTKGLEFGYTASNSRYTLAGSATAAVAKLGNLGVTFGYGTNPGLVITSGTLTSLDMTLTTDVTVGGVGITTKGLEFGYSAANSQYTLAGSATANVAKLGSLGVTFGYGANPGLVITNGSLSSLDMTLTTDVTVAGVGITTKGLRFGYTAATSQYTLAGSATASVAKFGNLGVTFGFGSKPGLVVTNGSLTSLDFTLTSDVTVAGVGITTKGLVFGYTAATSQYTLGGTATATVGKLGTLGVTLGYGTNPGLVVTNGSLTSLDMTLNTDVTLAGVTITTKGLEFKYAAANDQYSLMGSATAAVTKLGTLGVTFGYGSNPGLVVVNGSLSSLDMTLTTDLSVAGVGITTKGLRFGYTAANSQYTLAGTATANVAKLGTLGVTFGYGNNPGLVVTSGSLTSLDMTLTTDLSVAGVAITTKGLRFGYSAANSQYTLAGTATASVAKLGNLGVTFGFGTNPGLVVTNGSLTSLDMTLTTDLSVAGVAITAKGLRFGYSAANSQYTLAGTATASVAKIGNLGVTFGYGSNPGLVVTNGSLASLDMTLNTDITVGGVGITTKGLRFGYTAANSQYTLAGTATAAVAKLGTLGVTFGYGSNPGLVVTNGSLTSLDLTLNTDVTVGGVAITTKGLRFGYTAANSQYTLAGTASASVAKLGSLGVTFGFGSTPGLVVTNGSLTSLDMTLNTDITVGGVKITTKGLRFGYTAADSRYTLAGTASATVARLGNLGITFGNGTNPGLVVTNGSLDVLDMTLNSDITVGSVNIATKGLRFTYTAANSQYTLTGTASVAVARLGNLAVTFGYGGKPGLVITNGSLDSLDMTLNSNIRVGSVTFSTQGLRFTYAAANSQYTLTGTASVSIARLGNLSVTFGYGGNPGLVITNGSLDSLDLTLNSQIRVQTLVFRTEGLRFTYTAATDTFTLSGTAGVTILGIGDVAVTFGYGGKPGLVISNGSLDSLDLTLNSKIRVQSLIFRTEGLRFTYTAATDTFTLSGTAGVMILGIGDVSVTFGYGNKPGLLIQNGSLVSLDMTLNTDIRVNAVVFSTKNLNFSYTTATKQFTMAGQAGVGLVGVGGLVVTFGNGGKPGLVITDGSLTSLDMTVGSDFNVGAVKFSGTGLRFQYTAANSTFTLTGSAGVTVAGMNAITVTFGKGSTPGLQVTDGKLVGLDMTVTSDVKVAGFTLAVKDLEFAYTASTNTFTIRGSASLSLGFQSFDIQLGNGAGSQGIIIKDGTLTDLDGKVSSTFSVAGLSFGTVSLHLVYSKASGTFDLDGNADLTLTASLPGFFSKFLSLKSLSTHLGTINLKVHSVAGNNGASYTSFSASLAGYTVGVTVKFNGDVSVTGVSDAIVQGIVDAAAKVAAAAAAAAKAAADAAAAAAKAVANAASKAASTVSNGAKSVGSAIKSFFDNEIAGGTVFYDANGNAVLDAGELFATTGADGSFVLDVPADAPGQLVGFGGINVATNLPNTTVFTAPVNSFVVSPLTALVQSVRTAFPGMTAAEAAVTVATALGIPDSIDLLGDNVIAQALSGNADAARAFDAAVQIAGLVGGTQALVGGSEAVASAAAFGSLATQLGYAAGPLDLTDAAVVQQVLQTTADRTGATLDPAVVAGAAAVLAGINEHIASTPATGGREYMTRVVQSQIAAGTAAVPMLVKAASGEADIDAVVAAQTGPAFAAQAAAIRVGALAAPVSNLSPTYAVAAGVGGAPRVTVYDRQSGTQMADFFSFESTFRGGASAAVGDVNGDGVADVVVAAGVGGAARVIVIDGTKLDEVTAAGEVTPDAVLANFYAFEESFRGGASVALAQLGTGSGLNIVVGAGTGGGPRVRTFAFDPTAAGGVSQLSGPIGDFFAFDPTARYGVNVAAGDLDGIGQDNVIVGAGVGGSPLVAVYLPDGTLQREFMAYDPDLRGGVSVAAGYLNGTPNAQLVTGSGPGGPAVVNVYDGFNETPDHVVPVFDADYTGGVWVASGSAGDHSEIVYGAASGSPRVGVVGTNGLPVETDFSSYDSTFLGGVSVG